MKLFFPKGEHAPVDFSGETLAVGSSPACQVVLNVAGVLPRHCEVSEEGGRALVTPLAMSAPTLLNNQPISGATEIKGGDLLMIGSVSCRAVATERKPAGASTPRPPADDSGQTRVRMALPKYALRGVSGVTFGKVFSVRPTMTVGRSQDCDICIPSEEISRHHARLHLVPDGVMVEDTGSANGTYVNDQRISAQTLLKPGGELRMDVVRFQLVAPGKDDPAPTVVTTPQKGKRSMAWLWILIVVLAAAGAAYYAMSTGLVKP
jgi:pSer/pThr/pTyr-binding forkhead associated (FHA) protein